MKLHDYSDAELGAIVRDRFERLAKAHADGLTDTHPRDAWNADNAVLRGGQDDNSGLGPKDNVRRGSPSEEEGATDDVQPSEAVTGGRAPNKKPTMDGALSAAIDRATGPRRAHPLERIVKGYGRL
jgi:hypothetical protein